MQYIVVNIEHYIVNNCEQFCTTYCRVYFCNILLTRIYVIHSSQLLTRLEEKAYKKCVRKKSKILIIKVKMDYTDIFYNREFNERENNYILFSKHLAVRYQQQNKEHFQQQASAQFYLEDMPPCARQLSRRVFVIHSS